jgi:hypothetical protein
MGSISIRGVGFLKQKGQAFARMTGRVSMAKRGGSIQMRPDLASPPSKNTTGVWQVVRDNGRRHLLHLCTLPSDEACLWS